MFYHTVYLPQTVTAATADVNSQTECMLPETQTDSTGHFAVYYDKYHYFFCTSIQKLQHNIGLCKQRWTEASVTKKNMKKTARATLKNG